MGKSFELLGMMAFQTFLVLIVGVSLMTTSKEATPTTLTTASIEQFIEELSNVTAGKKEGMDSAGVTEFLMKHLASGGEFITQMTYIGETMEEREEDITMSKLDYISNVLQGLENIEEHESSLHIDHINISSDGQEALVVFSNYEEGRMPLPSQVSGMRKIAMSGTSYCEQKLGLTEKQVIQLLSENCITDISFIDE